MMITRFTLYLSFIFVLAFTGHAQNADQTTSNHTIDSLLDRLNKTTDQVQQSKLMHDIGTAYKNINPEIALSYFNRGSVLADTSDHSQVLKFLIDKAICYTQLRDQKKAIAIQLQALRMIDKYDDLEQMRDFVMSNLAGSYMTLQQYSISENILNKVVANIIKKKQYHKLAQMYTNLSTIAGKRGDDKKCIYYCTKAIEANEKYPVSADRSPLVSIYTNAGFAYMNLGQTKQSRIFYNRALRLAKTNDGLANIYKSLGSLSLQENNPNQAVEHYLTAEKIATENKINRLLPNLYDNLSTAYAKAGNVEQSILYKDKLIAAHNETFNEELAKQVSEMQAKYEAEKKDIEISSLNKDQEIAHARVEYRNLVIILFACILIMGFILGRNILLKQRVSNERLGVENVLLQKEKIEARYEMLKSRVNPHFLFNGLSTLASVVNEDPTLAEKFIVRFSQLYRAILETGNTSLVTLGEEMKVVENYLYLQQVRFEDSLILDVQIPEALYDYKIPPFSLQLVVENAIKHNIVNPDKKLTLRIYVLDSAVVVENSLQERLTGVISTGIGQESIRERYKIVSDTAPEFIKTETVYLVKLPLIKENTKIPA
jgi:tetratricopeptide (TPR) repeat protein